MDYFFGLPVEGDQAVAVHEGGHQQPVPIGRHEHGARNVRLLVVLLPIRVHAEGPADHLQKVALDSPGLHSDARNAASRRGRKEMPTGLAEGQLPDRLAGLTGCEAADDCLAGVVQDVESFDGPFHAGPEHYGGELVGRVRGCEGHY